MAFLTVFMYAVAAAVIAVNAYPAIPYGGTGNLAGVAQQALYQVVRASQPYVEPPPEERNYRVYYSVKDDPSYNYQTRTEEKKGKTVTGQYTLIEANGDLRVVDYIADENGFRATVQTQPNYAPAAPAPAPYVAAAAPGRTYN